MSSRCTGTSSLMQKYCWRSREPHVLCSRLNEIARLASVAEKSLTGIETSPKDTVNEAIERAAMSPPKKGSDCNTARFLRFGAFQGALQARLRPERVAPAIAGLREALGSVRDAKVERMRLRQLVPSERHRDRGARCAARRIGHIQRLAAHVHVVVHEDLAGALGYAPLHGDVLRMPAHEMPADELRDRARRVEVDGAVDRHEDMQARLPRGLHDRLERHAIQQLAQPERDLLAFFERHRVELGLLARLLHP